MNRPFLTKLFIFAFVFVMSLKPHLDSDFGWHLRYGEHFLKTGQVLKANTLSYVWPDYQWIQASWAYDLIVYHIFLSFGWLGLSLSAALITLSIFWLITYPPKNLSPLTLFFLSLIFLTQAAPLYFTGLRSQALSTLLFALALLLTVRLLSPRRSSPLLYALYPLLFLLWANLHGGFSLGLFTLTIYWGTHGFLLGLNHLLPTRKIAVTTTKLWALFGVTLALAYVTPLINPWGSRIWEETFKHSTNKNLLYITEWASLTELGAETLVAAAIAGLVFFVGLKHRFWSNLPFLLSFLFVALLAVSAIRFMIIFSLMATYFLAHHLPQLSWRPLARPAARLAAGLGLIGLITFDLLVSQRYSAPLNLKVFNFTWDDYCTIPVRCSEGVTQAMLKNIPQGHGYHPYDYGGYLSWRVPQVQTFLDGRMAAWEKDGQTPPVVDGDLIIVEKDPIAFRRFDSQYHFRWVILPTNAPNIKYFDQLSQSSLWERRYQDEFFAYYVKKD